MYKLIVDRLLGGNLSALTNIIWLNCSEIRECGNRSMCDKVQQEAVPDRVGCHHLHHGDSQPAPLLQSSTPERYSLHSSEMWLFSDDGDYFLVKRIFW